jgi:hypothetical protein
MGESLIGDAQHMPLDISLISDDTTPENCGGARY